MGIIKLWCWVCTRIGNDVCFFYILPTTIIENLFCVRLPDGQNRGARLCGRKREQEIVSMPIAFISACWKRNQWGTMRENEKWKCQLLSHVRLCDHVDCSPPGSSVHGIFQARVLEWVAIAFSNAWKWKVKVKSLSRVWLLATPWTAAYQAPPSMGFSRQKYWSGVPLLLP